jgi:hypothetical protein
VADHQLQQILDRLATLSPEVKNKLVAEALGTTAKQVWVPDPGPQTDAYFSLADEMFYGGAAGGGKTELIIGLALTQHKRSLILRRINKDVNGIVDRVEQILGHRDGYNGQLQRWKLPMGKQIDFGGCEQEIDKQRYKGIPHDLIGFDEGSDFVESQFRFIKLWNRTAAQHQRCRIVVASNPPTTPEGLWVLKYWGPWLDETHPDPAKPGEIRWFVNTYEGEDVEVEGPGPHVVPGFEKPVLATSRTFIRSFLENNYELSQTDYEAKLAGAEPELRSAYRDGKFAANATDHIHQVIPTGWIEAAQQRWTPSRPDGYAMTAMAVDIAMGGKDKTAIVYRYGGWFGPVDLIAGEECREGGIITSGVVRRRKDKCPVIIDMGGGWGGNAMASLMDNGIHVIPYNGIFNSTQRTRDGKNRFVNKRAEAIWRLREALDPDQEGGSVIALPPDPELRADLASYRWQLTVSGILIEDKKEIRKRIGRSPDKGDAVVMCLAEGQAALKKELMRGRADNARANLGYSRLKRHRHG